MHRGSNRFGQAIVNHFANEFVTEGEGVVGRHQYPGVHHLPQRRLQRRYGPVHHLGEVFEREVRPDHRTQVEKFSAPGDSRSRRRVSMACTPWGTRSATRRASTPRDVYGALLSEPLRQLDHEQRVAAGPFACSQQVRRRCGAEHVGHQLAHFRARQRSQVDPDGFRQLFEAHRQPVRPAGLGVIGVPARSRRQKPEKRIRGQLGGETRHRQPSELVGRFQVVDGDDQRREARHGPRAIFALGRSAKAGRPWHRAAEASAVERPGPATTRRARAADVRHRGHGGEGHRKRR